MNKCFAILLVALLAISVLKLANGSALNPPPSSQGPSEGAEASQTIALSLTQSNNTTRKGGAPRLFNSSQHNAPTKQEPAGDKPATAKPTFATIDITLDPLGKPLGAYQFELTSADPTFKIVGVSGGDHPAFDHGRPPYFDPVVLQGLGDRLILAEYALPNLAADQLPTRPLRIASVGVVFDRQVDNDEPPQVTLKLITAGDAAGNKIDAKLSHTLKTPERPER